MPNSNMDSRFHATVMRRAEDDQEEAASSIRRDGIMNGPSTTSVSGSNIIHDVASPRQQSQTEIRSILNPSTFSPGAPPPFNQYHQPTAAPQLIQPAHIPLPTTSTSALGLSTPLYPKERDSTYQRDQKPPSNYYDPTSDSSERRPTVTESIWSDREAKTSQVRYFPHTHEKDNQSPDILQKNRESYPYNQNQPPESSANGSLNQYNGVYKSPVNSHFPPRSPISHAHPQGRVPPPVTQSPRLTTMESPVSRHNGVSGGPVQHDRPAIKQEPVPASVSPNYIHLLLLSTSSNLFPCRLQADQQIQCPSRVYYRALLLNQRQHQSLNPLPLRPYQNLANLHDKLCLP